jgi:hypothetical protein
VATSHDSDIKKALMQSGLLNEQEAAKVIADLPSKPSAAMVAGFSLGSGVCKLLCQLAQSFCKIACEKISDATAKQLCLAACDTGETICEQKCH